MANSTNALDTSYKRLASGLRINSAKDDAAGLQISDRLTSQINGLNQGNRNAQDGISFAQTAEGAMDEMTNMYQRIRTLALQSANGTNSDADRVSIQQEVNQLCDEIDRINNDTTYGGKGFGSILTKGTVDFQVGADQNQKITIETLKFKGEKGGTGEDAKDIEDKTVTAWTVTGLATTLGVATGTGAILGTDGKDGAKATAFDVTDKDKAQAVLGSIDKFIAAVDSKRAEYGAVQNRLESTIRNQSNVAENVTAARSRIRDTDFASETAAMTQQNIIQQASQSILSQANQRPQVALSLLG